MAFLNEVVAVTTVEAEVITEGVSHGVDIIKAIIKVIKAIIQVTMLPIEFFPNHLHNPTRISPNPTQISQTLTLIAQPVKFAINKAIPPLIATIA